MCVAIHFMNAPLFLLTGSRLGNKREKQNINQYTIPTDDLSVDREDWTYTISDLLAFGARQKLGCVSFITVLDGLITIDTLDMLEAVLALFTASVSHSRSVDMWIGARSIRVLGMESIRSSLEQRKYNPPLWRGIHDAVGSGAFSMTRWL